MKRMYVFVRKDLAPSYRMVQGAHALAQFALEHPEEFSEWNNKTIVFLLSKNERELSEFSIPDGCKYSEFEEPDLDNELTSVACYAEEKCFNNFKLA